MSDELQVVIKGPDVATLMEVLKKAGYVVAKPNICIGYPECDGDLVASAKRPQFLTWRYSEVGSFRIEYVSSKEAAAEEGWNAALAAMAVPAPAPVSALRDAMFDLIDHVEAMIDELPDGEYKGLGALRGKILPKCKLALKEKAE